MSTLHLLELHVAIPLYSLELHLLGLFLQLAPVEQFHHPVLQQPHSMSLTGMIQLVHYCSEVNSLIVVLSCVYHLSRKCYVCRSDNPLQLERQLFDRNSLIVETMQPEPFGCIGELL